MTDYKDKYVLVRTYSAGVHFGYLKSLTGTEAVLTEARRLWYWDGAFTLSAVAESGINLKNSKISVAVPEILLTQAIEILPIQDAVKESLSKAEAHKP